MKKEGLKFTILASIWLLIFDILILKKVIKDYIIDKGLIPINSQIITGNFILYDATPKNIITKLIIPLIIYNIVIAILLYMNYKFRQRINKENISKSKKRPKIKKSITK